MSRYNNEMHSNPGLLVILKWKIYRPDSVIPLKLMRTLTPMLLLLAILSGCAPSDSGLLSTGDDQSVKSPDGKLLASSGATSKTLLLVDVTDSESGEVLASVNTNASRIHRWSLTWYDNETILVRSSDVGPITIKLQPDRSWKIGSPLRTPSLDQRFVSYSHSSNDHLVVSLLRVDGEPQDASSVAVKFNTELEITDYEQLEFCITWVGIDRLEARIENQSTGWTEQPDGSWLADDGTKYEISE